MKTGTIPNAFLTLLLSTATCGLAVAEPPERAPERGRRAHRAPMFRILDQDQDGQVSADEIDAWAAKLKGFDTDGDGSISQDEMHEAAKQARATFAEGRAPGPSGEGADAFRRGGPGQGRGLDRLFERDADGDGKLSSDELPEPLKERLAALDTDGDDAIDREELMQGMRRRGERARGQRPRRPDCPGQRPNRPAAPSLDDGIDV